MNSKKIELIIEALFKTLEEDILNYQNSPDDWNISEGNVAICIITDEGRVYGKLFGNDKLKQRRFYNVAWQKASQVWITGHKTGEYEKIVFGGGMDPEDSLISLPELIGWIGGQPIKIDNETQIAIGFSGFKGVNDIGIVENAIKKVMKEIN